MIVGGTRGAGAAAASLFRDQRCQVSVLARGVPKHKLQGVDYPTVDLCDAEALRTTLTNLHGARGPFDSVVFFQRYRGTGDSWEGELSTSLTATHQTIETLVHQLRFREGSIVIVSSVNASLISKSVSLGYHIAKAGLNQLTRYYAVLLGPLGIRVNSVSPGSFLKAENRKAIAANRELLDLHRKITPLGRLGTAEEVAKTIFFLSGPDASFITGQDIIIDGGISLVYQESLARLLVPIPPNVSA